MKTSIFITVCPIKAMKHLALHYIVNALTAEAVASGQLRVAPNNAF